MSTDLNPSCVCDTHHVSPVDQLFQRVIDWPGMEVVEPPPFGSPESTDVIRVEAPRHNWPVYLVHLPEDFKPNSWNSVPPNTQR